MADTGSVVHRRDRLRKAARALTMQARLVAIDAGLAHGHRTYRRFVILGQGRTGTNFLRGLLNSHGAVLAFGEVFRSDTEISWGIPLWHTSRRALSRAGTDANAFLDRHIFRAYPESIEAVGFKLFYNHAREASRRRVWDRIFDAHGPAVVHLTRRNLLKSLVSLRRAEMDGRWVATRPTASEPMGKIRLTYEECVDYFEQSLRWQEEHELRIGGQPRLNIVYEDLVSGGPVEHSRILEFLGVRPRQLRPGTLQQSHGPLRDVLENFAELERRFSGSRWHPFFED